MTKSTTSLITRSALLLIITLTGISGLQAQLRCDRNSPEACLYTSDLHYEVGGRWHRTGRSSRNNYRIRCSYTIRSV